MKARVRIALGIDIGERHVSAALVEKTRQGFRTIAAAGADLPGDQRPSPAKVLSRVLAKLGRRARTRGLRSAVAVSTDSVVIRVLDLPQQMPANVGEFVDNEMKQCVALSGRRITSDFCGIGIGSGLRKRVLAVAADAGQMGEIVKRCTSAGAAVDSVEPSSLAYARAFLAGEKGARRGGNAMIAVLGAHNLVVCLFYRGVLDFVRIRDIAAGMESPECLCAWLTEELDAVLRYCRTNTPGDGTEWQVRLVLHGAAYGKDDITPRLVVETGAGPLEIVDCYEPVAGSRETAKGPLPQTPSAVAVGAAMRLLNPQTDDLRIDLTPVEVLRARSSSRHVLIMANAVAVALIAVFLIAQLLSRTAEARHREIRQTRLAEQLCTMPAMVAEDRYIDKEITRIRRHLAELEPVRERRQVDWSLALDEIGRAAPTGVCITHLACGDGRSVSLKGLATSSEMAKSFVKRLDGRTPFESVRLAHFEQHGDGNFVEYEIDGTLRPMNPESADGD